MFLRIYSCKGVITAINGLSYCSAKSIEVVFLGKFKGGNVKEQYVREQYFSY